MKTGDVYRVKHNNKDYGEFRKLSDALYERDALFFCNFDYDLLVECDLTISSAASIFKKGKKSSVTMRQ